MKRNVELAESPALATVTETHTPDDETRRRCIDADIGIERAQRGQIIGTLNSLLANELLLELKTRKFAWNVTGHDREHVRPLLSRQIKAVQTIMNKLSERIRILGGNTVGTVDELSRISKTEDQEGEYPTAPEMLRLLLVDHELMIKAIRPATRAIMEEQADYGTAHDLISILKKHESVAFKLRSHLNI
jgi:starvation-inducible DNA-binding protein